MGYKIGDIFIGEFPIIQSFGVKPDEYSARYGLKGHNGVDWGCPSMTPVLAGADGTILETGFDESGYGNEIKILHDGFITKYGHLNDIAIKTGEHVIAGQLIGHSNNTGFSDTPHLHFAVAPADLAGAKSQEDNGFSGYINPMGPDIEWRPQNLQAPILPSDDTKPSIPVAPDELSIKTTEANNFLTVHNFILNNNGDIEINPSSPMAGEEVNKWISGVLEDLKKLKEALDYKTETDKKEQEKLTEAQEGVKKNLWVGIFLKIKNGMRDFIFTPKQP